MLVYSKEMYELYPNGINQLSETTDFSDNLLQKFIEL